MNQNAHVPVGRSMDSCAMPGMEAPPVDFAERACHAWLDGAQVMQAEAAEFVNARAGKDAAALSEWVRCTTPAEALEMQMRYTSEAVADYVAESQRMWNLLAWAGQHGVARRK